MKRSFCCAFAVLFFLWSASPARAGLAEDVRSVLNDKLLRKVNVGVAVLRLDPSGPVSLFHNQADRLFVPASNLKLVTTAAALHHLGAEFRFRTYLLINGDNVVLWGDGDPTLGDAEMLKPVGWDVDTVFQSWAQELLKKNITAIGDVIVDDSVFDEIFLHPNWPADQVHKRYVAEVGGVNLNANCVDFLVQATAGGQYVNYFTNPGTRYVTVANTCVTGTQNAIWLSRMPLSNAIVLRGETPRTTDVPVSVTIHDPPMFAATVLSEALSASGVTVTGTVRRDRTTRARFSQDQQNGGGHWSIVAVHETPLATVLARANKDSMNVYAESLCKRTGHAASGGESGSWANGLNAIGQYLTSIGVPAGQFSLDDGSGLSKHNLISPGAVAKVLADQFSAGSSKLFIDSLAVAGEDGTLQTRFRGTDLRGRVHAKSGYISGVSSLSGYLRGADDRWYAFSILMNNITDNATMKAMQERIVRAIDGASR